MCMSRDYIFKNVMHLMYNKVVTLHVINNSLDIKELYTLQFDPINSYLFHVYVQ